MLTVSFEKDIVITEPKAVEKLINALSSKEVKSVNKKLASNEAMDKGEELLKQCLFRSKSS